MSRVWDGVPAVPAHRAPSLRWLGALCLAMALTACGGGGGSSPVPGTPPVTITPLAPNAQAVSVYRGPSGSSVNIPFVDVTLCLPGSSSCETIRDVVLDTGSSGLRLRSGAVSATMRQQLLGLAPAPALLNCVQFIDGTYLWGPVVTVDLVLASEKAASLPVQLFDDAAYVSVPPACAAGGDSGSGYHANGIIGLGVQKQDCGDSCANITRNGVYFSCTGASCTGRRASLAQQVKSPVPLFPTNNNGLMLELPAVPSGSAVSAVGTLTFGIGTQSNNQLATETVLPLDSVGYFTTQFLGNNMVNSFIDSGSNGLYFDPGGLPACGFGGGASPSFYCPASTSNLQAVLVGLNGTRSSVNFSIGNAENLFNQGALAAFPTLGGPRGNFSSFDWGLPFFYGRRVSFAIEGQSTARGMGPYVAF